MQLSENPYQDANLEFGEIGTDFLNPPANHFQVDDTIYDVPRPTYAKFPTKDAQKYIDLYQKALNTLKQDKKVSFQLLINPASPGNLGMAVGKDEFMINADAYKAFNQYARLAYDSLFPTEYVKSFANDPRINSISNIIKENLVIATTKQIRSGFSKGADLKDYSMAEKRSNELGSSGSRMGLPSQFFETALSKLNSHAENEVVQKFIKYLAMLVLSAYTIIEQHSKKTDTPLISFDEFFAGEVYDVRKYPIYLALQQTTDNYYNFSQLLAGILHASEMIGNLNGEDELTHETDNDADKGGGHSNTHAKKALNMTLRQYFTDEKGRELVAKCGFLNAFHHHIPEIVLADD